MRTARKIELPNPWTKLVELCREINFGYIEGVQFQDGLPTRYGPVIKTVMPGPNKNNGPATAFDGSLKPQWADVYDVAQSATLVSVRRFEVAHGNPLKLHV